MAVVRVQVHDISGELNEPIQRLLAAMGLATVNLAKALCPVDTGRLRSSIAFEVDGLTMRAGTDVEYSLYVEMGTRFMRARPYLRPALFAAVAQAGFGGSAANAVQAMTA